jgi:hypothetical protein
MAGYRETHISIDRITQSPLEYAAQILKGNSAPCFNPEHPGFNEMYNDEVNLIVAVTAENPNLWLDPTICFYLMNCCAVSLLKKKGSHTNLGMGHFTDTFQYETHIQEQLNALKPFTKQTWDWEKGFANFDFFRFFLYDGKQRESLVDTVFPSLKASHDLFQMKSYFNQKEDIKNKLPKNTLSDYHAHIDFLWDEIIHNNRVDDFKTKLIDNRKKEHLPEFLFLFKTNPCKNIHSVTVHTFVEGYPCSVEYRESKESNSGYQRIQSLISYIATGVKDIGINGQYIPTVTDLNTRNSHLEWS